MRAANRIFALINDVASSVQAFSPELRRQHNLPQTSMRRTKYTEGEEEVTTEPPAGPVGLAIQRTPWVTYRRAIP